jgi:hypothetical protein
MTAPAAPANQLEKQRNPKIQEIKPDAPRRFIPMKPSGHFEY